MTAPALSANNFYQILKMLLAETGADPWASATVLTKHRSSYRKPGAMMLVSPLGRTFGLISGGCLESDIVVRARRALEYGEPEFVIYDSTEDGNIAAELGLGCNGRIGVLVEEISDAHRRLYGTLLERMEAGRTTGMLHSFDSGLTALLNDMREVIDTIGADTAMPDLRRGPVPEQQWALVDIKPPVRLLVAGGGVDARPVAEFAAKLGWRVTVADHRTVNARRQDFPLAETLIHQVPGDLAPVPPVDAAVIMTHNLDMDAGWIRYCSELPGLHYVGLLGPVSRKQEVLSLAGLSPDLPEAVAISVIAQCHQSLADAGMV